jgi:hypothetical protein
MRKVIKVPMRKTKVMIEPEKNDYSLQEVQGPIRPHEDGARDLAQ